MYGRTNLFPDFFLNQDYFKVSWIFIPHYEFYNLAAAAAAKSLQSCPTLCDPVDGSPPGSPIPGILQARILQWVAISFSSVWKWKVKVKSLSRVQLLATPWTAAYQAPLSMGFSSQEYWSGVPLPSPKGSGNFYYTGSLLCKRIYRWTVRLMRAWMKLGTLIRKGLG